MRHLIALFMLLCLALPAYAGDTITVYSNIEPDMVAKYTRAFNEAHPDITIKWVRDSAGPITARLLAEKDNPQADMVFGLALNSLLSLEPYGIFEPYTPKDFGKIAPNMRDKRPNPVWVGINAWGTSFCINKPELEKRGLPVPRTWQDLLNPVYQGLLVMPNPASSSTGYMAVAGWLQSMGDKAAWEYMQQLHKNIKMYVHSGCKPAQMAAQGEIVIGISSNSCATPYLARRAPLLIITPQDGVGWDMETAALLKNRPNRQAAQKFMDFATSEAAARIAAENGYIPGRQEMNNAEGKAIMAHFVDMDFYASAKQRADVLKKWRALFESN